MGGYAAGELTGMVNYSDYMYGLLFEFNSYYIFYAMVKTIVFAFIISSVSAYIGYTVKGGAVEVGNSSTSAVVNSSIALIVANYFLTDFMLS